MKNIDLVYYSLYVYYFINYIYGKYSYYEFFQRIISIILFKLKEKVLYEINNFENFFNFIINYYIYL